MRLDRSEVGSISCTNEDNNKRDDHAIETPEPFLPLQQMRRNQKLLLQKNQMKAQMMNLVLDTSGEKMFC